MGISAWFWPASGAAARSAGLLPYAGGLAVPDWSTPAVWPFNPVAGAFGAPVVLAPGPLGLTAADVDGVGGLHALSFDGRLWHIDTVGTVTLEHTYPSGSVWEGCATAGGTTGPWQSTSNGAIYSSGGTLLANFGQTSRDLVASGSTLATSLPVSGVIGLVALPGGATSMLALPANLSRPTCLAVDVSLPLAVGGWAPAAPLAGAYAVAGSPADPKVALGVGSGSAVSWASSVKYGADWAPTHTLAGLADLRYLAWVPNGGYALASSPGAGDVQVLTYGGSLTLAQTISVSGAGALAVQSDSIHALVCQPSLNQVTGLKSVSNIWSVNTTVSGLSGAISVAPAADHVALVGVMTGLAVLALSGDTWALSGVIGLPFRPLCMVPDQFGVVYAVGVSGIAAVSGTTLLGSGAWTGSTPSAIAVDQGRVAVAVPADDAVYLFGQISASGWGVSGVTQVSLASGGGAVGIAGATLFVAGSGSTLTYDFSGAPFKPQRVQAGAFGVHVGSGWTTYQLAGGQLPSALRYDSSGDLWAATAQNDLFCFNPSGMAVISQSTVPQYYPQDQSVPIGAASILNASGFIYVGTSLPGVLVRAAVAGSGVVPFSAAAYPYASGVAHIT